MTGDEWNGREVPTTGDGVLDLVKRLQLAEQTIRDRDSQIVSLRLDLRAQQGKLEMLGAALFMAVLVAFGTGWVVGAGYLLLVVSWIVAAIVIAGIVALTGWWCWKKRPSWLPW